MKKAKFMLLGIGVLGVAGGALAFNADKFLGTVYCTDQSSTDCIIGTTYKLVPGKIGAQFLHCTLTSLAGPGQCTKTVTVSLNN